MIFNKITTILGIMKGKERKAKNSLKLLLLPGCFWGL